MAIYTNHTTPVTTGLVGAPLFNGANYTSSVSVTPTVLTCDVDAYFNADVKLQGKSLAETLSKIEERLNIVTPNIQLEKEWEELRELGEKYRQLEKEILQKMAVFNELKK